MSESLKLTQYVCKEIDNLTFHLHYHILYDLAEQIKGEVNYLEIGCYGGGSACLMLQRPNTNVVSVDLGGPITQETAEANVNKLNLHNNKFTYVKGDSHNPKTKDRVIEICKEFDILFIDGDHSYNGVKKDFEMYGPLVKSGGYIVFDDYLDAMFSPEVKKGVDDILENLEGFEKIGVLRNHCNAPSLLDDNIFNNCYILRKL